MLIWSFFYVTLMAEFSKAKNNPKNRPITPIASKFLAQANILEHFNKVKSIIPRYIKFQWMAPELTIY